MYSITAKILSKNEKLMTVQLKDQTVMTASYDSEQSGIVAGDFISIIPCGREWEMSGSKIETDRSNKSWQW